MSATTSEIIENHLLAALPPQERERWLPFLEMVVVVAGQVLHEARRLPRYAYFPVDAVVSLQVQSEDGARDEVAIVGREGMVGVSAFTGIGSSTFRCVVQRPGRVLRLGSEQIRTEVDASRAALRLLLQYAKSQASQVAQGVVCSRHHNIEQRLALRLLVALDRQQDNQPLAMTQEQLSGWLGVRRESVTDEAQKLQKAGLIAYTRGRITVVDPMGLERRACECLSVLTSEFPPWGTAAASMQPLRGNRESDSPLPDDRNPDPLRAAGG